MVTKIICQNMVRKLLWDNPIDNEKVYILYLTSVAKCCERAGHPGESSFRLRILSSIGLSCRPSVKRGSCLLLFVNHTADRQLASPKNRASRRGNALQSRHSAADDEAMFAERDDKSCYHR